MARARSIVVAVLAVAIAMLTGSCSGCKKTPPAVHPAHDDKPSVRLYLLSNLSGALEPCGCSKDQLGGLDHLAAFVRGEGSKAPRKLVLSAGPTLYIDPTLDPQRAAQDRWKAEAIADAMKSIELSAWVPGYNDWSDGSAELARLAARTGAKLLAADLGGATQLGASAHTVIEVGGVKVGIIGVAAPRDAAGKPPAGIDPPADDAAIAIVNREADKLRQQGARILVAMVALPRGAALRIADAVPALNVLVIGKQLGRGHANTAQPTPELVGSTLVIETANHAQTVAVVDLYLRGEDPAPKLADAGGVAQAAKIGELTRRIRELENRINGWEKGGKTDANDLAARKADLVKLKGERDALQAEQPAPTGSFFRYAVHEVRDGMGKDEAVSRRMLGLYKQINEHNKTALADLKPPAAGADEASFIGVEACTTCHEEERKVWDGTAHAHGYKTLVDGFKEYNLECVGCHVTGYGKPGGSTVTHNDKLRDVQCEECHGPGSKHAKKTDVKGLIVVKPDPKTCVEACHHPPHVEGFDAAAKMDLVLGPGHGKP
jgi:hypothetical protein